MKGHKKNVYTIRFYIYLCMQAVRTTFKQRRMKAKLAKRQTNVWDSPHQTAGMFSADE